MLSLLKSTRFCVATVALLGMHTALADSLLNNSNWTLVEFQSMDDAQGIKRPADPSLYTMQLHDDGSVTMQLNCNRAKGRWNVRQSSESDRGQFEFSPLAMTRAMCPPPSMDAFIAAQSDYVRSYVIKDDRLYLSLMTDAGIFVWQRQGSEMASASPIKAVSPTEGGPRHWQVTHVSTALNMREQPAATAHVVARLNNGQVLTNLGCEQVAGQVWCDVQPFTGGPRGYVSHAYLAGAVGPGGSVVTGEDDSALRAGQGDFDASGELPCANEQSMPMRQCPFGVARSGPGYATVVITRPDGRTRAIYFVLGQPIGADVSQADWGEFSASKVEDLNFISVGAERYEIPDAVVLGG